MVSDLVALLRMYWRSVRYASVVVLSLLLGRLVLSVLVLCVLVFSVLAFSVLVLLFCLRDMLQSVCLGFYFITFLVRAMCVLRVCVW